MTETWLSELVFDKEILPSHYAIYRKDRGSRGGGVLVAVDESIPSSLIDSPPNLEIIVVHAAGANISYYSVYSLHPTQLK